MADNDWDITSKKWWPNQRIPMGHCWLPFGICQIPWSDSVQICGYCKIPDQAHRCAHTQITHTDVQSMCIHADVYILWFSLSLLYLPLFLLLQGIILFIQTTIGLHCNSKSTSLSLSISFSRSLPPSLSLSFSFLLSTYMYVFRV